jgi:predicted RNA-binding Zn-ribbon protein involved in translation (DUF1610 family)
MKFLCECGHTIVDQTDDLSYKAYARPDQTSEAFFAAVERLVDATAPSDPSQRDALTGPILFPKGTRHMYQCPDCGRVFIGDGEKLHCFKPEFDGTPKTLFATSR